MTSERVRELIGAYNYNMGRAGHLRQTISELEREYRETRKELIDAAASPKAKVITDMPIGGGERRDKVSELAVKIADGGEFPETQRILDRISACENEMQEKLIMVAYVDSWLKALPERLAFIVKAHCIDGLKWWQIEREYKEKYEELSRDTLRRMKWEALRQVYHIVL